MNFFRVTIFILILSSCSASAEFYKWVDVDGVTHYGDVNDKSGVKVELPKDEYKEVSQADRDQVLRAFISQRRNAANKRKARSRKKKRAKKYAEKKAGTWKSVSIANCKKSRGTDCGSSKQLEKDRPRSQEELIEIRANARREKLERARVRNERMFRETGRHH